MLDKDFGENYVNLNDNSNSLVGNFSNTTVQYKKIEPKDIPGVK